MSFLTPLFLLATLAAAIPVILHMVNRQKAKQLPFSTLRFLRISVQKTRRRKQVHDLLLMLLRAALLLLIALGLARPTITHLAALWGRGSITAVAIVLDNSASMAVMDQGKPRFQTALHAAQQILKELREGDMVALLPTCGPALADQARMDRGPGPALAILNQCQASYERADLGFQIREARKLLADVDAANRHIYVITDMQKLSWDTLKKESEEPAPDSSDRDVDNARKTRLTPIIIVDCNRAPVPNLAVQGVAVEAAVPVAGLPVKATAELFNAAPIAQSAKVELYVDEAKEATSPDLSIPPEGRVQHAFPFTFKGGGLHRGEVRLVGEDGSPLDNRRFFTMEIDQGIPVAIVGPQRNDIHYLDDTFYVEQALAPSKAGGSAIRPTVLTAKQLLGEPLAGYTVIFCVNLPAPDSDAAERLRAYVEGGGNLVWICGENVQPEAYNQMNVAAKDQLLPAPLLDIRAAGAALGRDAWNIGFLDKTDRALGGLVEPPGLYQSVLVYKHVRMDAKAAPGCSVLARLDDGEPLLIERKGPHGRVMMLGTTAHKDWTNLPLRPIFLPLLVRLTYELAGAEQVVHSVLAGAPLVLEFPEENQPLTVEVIPPDGSQNRLPTKPEAGRLGQTFRYTDTHQVGVYLLRLLGAARPKQVAFSVNIDPDEADPAKLDPEELQERLGSTPVIFADDPDDLSSTFKGLREGKSLWGAFLVVVLICLVFETFLSNRFSPKQEGEGSGPRSTATTPVRAFGGRV